MVGLKPITEDNFVDAFNLSLAPGQEEWVSHPVRSLAQAYVYRDQYQPIGDSAHIALTYHKDNRVALALYEKKGFTATGAVYDDEVELVMTLE